MSDAALAAPTEKIDLRTRLALLWATFFGVGYIPGAPGTYGTAAAIPLAWAVSKVPQPWQLFTAIGVAAIVTVLGIFAAARAGKHFGVVDASHIVVDEVAGLLITMCGVPFTWQSALAGFVFFRIFDIVKPWPASYFDTKVKNGAGVMLDDVAAGVYSRIALALLAMLMPAWFIAT